MEIKQAPASQFEVIVKKEREKEYEETIQNQWKDVRSRFFCYQIQSKLDQTSATVEEKQLIITLFVEKQLKVDINKLEQLAKYRKEIQQLTQVLKQIKDQYQRKQRECLPIQKIIKDKYTRLTTICIQYQLNQLNNYRYSISAFKLFAVVHTNKLLHKVTLKGVQVQQFTKFTYLLNRLMHGKTIQQIEMNELSWMRSFSPSKSLKLSINAKVQFKIQNKDDTLSKINDLVFFQSLFCSLKNFLLPTHS